MKTLNKYILFIIVVCSFAFHSCTTDNKFYLEGTIDDDVPYIILLNKGTMDTITVNDNVFSFQGIVDTVHLAQLKSPSFAGKKDLIIEPGTINIKWDGQKNFEASGTPNNESFSIYTRGMDSTTAIVLERYQDYMKAPTPEAKEEAMRQYNIAEEERLVFMRAQLRQNPNYTGLMILKPIYRTDSLNNLEEYLSLLSDLSYTDIYKEVDQYYSAVTNTAPGMPVPGFTLKDKDDNNISINSFRGKYVLLDFWFTGCAYCDKLIPHFREIYEELRDKDFEIIGISVDQNKSTWLETLEKKNTPWIQLLDNEKKVASQFGMAGYPTLILIDNEGYVAKRLVGYREKEDLIKEINEIMK